MKSKEDTIIETAPLREQVADIIRRKIITGELKSNQKISERQIGEMLNVSTTPVKEAFRILQGEGLITSVPRSGSFISANTEEHFLQLILLRSSIDGVAAYLAARSAPEDKLREMEHTLDRAGRLIASGKPAVEALSGCNEAFHRMVRESSGNDQIVRLGATLGEADNSVRRVINMGPQSGIEVRHRQHLAILEAIRQGNSQQAEALMIDHIRSNSLRVVDKQEEQKK